MATGISDIYLTSLRLARGADADAATVSESARVKNAVRATGLGGDSGRLSHHRVTDALAQSLTRRLTAFGEVLDRFSWPSETWPWSKARLVVRDQETEKSLAAVTAPTFTAEPFYKYFSDGKATLTQDSGIAAGDYSFRVTQGDASRTLTVGVAEGESWGDVLTTVKNAINATDLSVRADIERQQAPFTLDPSLAATGYVLALSVNPLRDDQSVTVADTSGHLLDELGMTRSALANTPAETGLTYVSVRSASATTRYHSASLDPGAATTLALGRHDFSFALSSDATTTQATTYLSKTMNTDAATTLAPGTYTFGMEYNGQSRDLSVTVRSGWTWGDVMRGVGAAIRAEAAMATDGGVIDAPSYAIQGVSVSLDDAPIPLATKAGAFTDGQMLTVAAAATDAAGALKLTDGTGGILSSLGLTTALRGTPLSITVQAGWTEKDVAEAVARVAAMSSTRLAAEVKSALTPSYVVPGKALTSRSVTVGLTLVDRRISETLHLHDGATGLLSSLSLTDSQPGQDGLITVGGTAMTSENDAYSLEQGRLLVTARSENVEDLPLRVVAGMQAVEAEVGEVVAAYDGVMRLLHKNRDILDKGLRARLEAPVLANMAGLSRLGVSRTTKTGELWIDRTTFWTTLGAEGPGARATLWSGQDALIPAWRAAVADVLSLGSPSFFKPETAFLNLAPATMSELDLEKKNRLVDLLG